MKKNNNKFLKKIFIGSSFLFLPFLAINTISCSNRETINASTEKEIENQFRIFKNSLVKEQIRNNLYFENFNFYQDVNTNSVQLTINEINDFLSISPLSNSYNYLFLVSKNENQQSISIEMEIHEKNSNRKYKNSNYIKTINGIKSLTEQEKITLNKNYLDWKSQINNIEITNTTTNQKLNNSEFNTILPSYLKVENINIDYQKALTSIGLTKEKSLVSVEFNDWLGQIQFDLKIIDPKTKLVFYESNYEKNHILVLNNFAKQTERNNEISSIYNVLSKIIDVETILPSNIKLPYLPSGINNFEKIKELIINLKNNSENKENEIINNIITVLENSTQQNKWFKLTTKTVGNDVTGSLVITWTIVDRFTNYSISPININKITTINNLYNLKNSITNVDHIYQSYNLLKTLKTNSKYKVKASTIKATDVNNDWILSNTNIKTLFSNIAKSTDGQYLEFSVTSNSVTSSFRFKVNTPFVIANDIDGTLSIPFIMEIKLTNNEFNTSEKEKFINVLPPSGISGTGQNQSYNSAISSASIVIGDYLINHIDIASKIYNYFKTNQNIEITIDNEFYFNDLIGKTQDEFVKLFEEEIKEKVKNGITTNQEEVKNFLNSFKILFAISNNKIVAYDKNSKTISTESVDIKLVNKNSETEQIEIPFYDNGTVQSFPKSKFTIKLISNK